MNEAASLAPPLLSTGGETARRDRRCGAASLIPAAAAIVAGAAVGAAVWLAMRPGAAHVTRFALSPTGAAALSVDQQSRDLAITPDGRHIVYKGRRNRAARSSSCAHSISSSRRR